MAALRTASNIDADCKATPTTPLAEWDVQARLFTHTVTVQDILTEDGRFKRNHQFRTSDFVVHHAIGEESTCYVQFEPQFDPQFYYAVHNQVSLV